MLPAGLALDSSAGAVSGTPTAPGSSTFTLRVADAATLVGVGSLAALSVKHATRRLAWLDPLTSRLPYASCAVLSLIGLLVAVNGARHLMR